MPSGSEKMMPVNEMTSVTRSPPQRRVSTCGKPEHSADQQEEGDDRKHPEEQDRVESLVGHARNEQRDQQDRAERVGQIDPPLFGLPDRSRT